jgi:hypothetical protein
MSQPAIQSAMVVIASMMIGCPWDTGASSSGKGSADAGFIDNVLNGAAGSADPQDVAQAVAEATAARFPPLPPLDTFCQLIVGKTNLSDVMKILGTPANETQDSMHASLSYRFQAPSDAGVGGSGGHAGASASNANPDSVSVYMTFDYSDGSPGIGSEIFGFGGSKSDLLIGYILKDASVEGIAYPACWPHNEP